MRCTPHQLSVHIEIDLVFHFRLGDTELTCDSTVGTLTGSTFDGQPIEGSDSVRMVGDKG